MSACADLIRGNSPLQERFGDIEVIWGSRSRGDQAANGHLEPERINVIEAFLKLSLEPSPNNLLDARLAACECMKAFFANHSGIRMHMLRRAIEGHTSGTDRIPNTLSVLLTAPELRGNADPYQVWMASVLMFHLIFDDTEAKAVAMGVTEGDAENGEEVVTSVQLVIGNLITGLQRGDDERITVGYLMLLCGWLFEDPDVVNDLLGEGSSIQTLVQEIKHQRAPSRILPGLCTVLLGIIYEFSTKDSPIPRATLHKLLLEQLGREQYIDKITKLRECPLVRDFEVLPQTSAGQLDGGLPEVYFDRSFVEFLKDNFSRLLRAIDREPGFEISVVANGVEKGVSRELVDSLRAQLEDRTQTMQKLESDMMAIQRKLDQELSDHRKTKETVSVELSKAQQAHQSLHYSHGQELSKIDEQHKQSKNELLKQHGEQLRAIDNQLKGASAEYERKSAKLKEHHDQEADGLHKTIRGLEAELSKSRQQHADEAARLKNMVQELEFTVKKSKESQSEQITEFQQKLLGLEATLASSKSQHETKVSGLKNTIQSLESKVADAKGQHTTELSGFKSTVETLEAKLADAKSQHEKEVSDLKNTIQTLESNLTNAKEQNEAETSTLKSTIQTLESNVATAKASHEAETTDLKETLESVQSSLRKAEEKSTKDLETANEGVSSKISSLETRAIDAEQKTKEAESAALKAAQSLKDLESQLEKMHSEAKEKEEARRSAQSELDDLLIVFGDLEAKRNQDKVYLHIHTIFFRVIYKMTNFYPRNDSRNSARRSPRMKTMTMTSKGCTA